MSKLIKKKRTPIDVFGQIKDNSEAEFVRKVGMTLAKFEVLLDLVKAKIAEEIAENLMKQRGLKSSISIENQLLLALYYIRDYPTQLKLGDTFGVCESYTCKIYNKMAKYMISVLKLPAKTSLKKEGLKQVIVDVSEQPIERPVVDQKDFFTGKKKRHTMKTLIFICALTYTILAVRTAKGSHHDFRMFKDCYKNTDIMFDEDVELLADLGFLGITNFHVKSRIPYKASKNHPLTEEQKKYNTELAKQRIRIEHINRRCKIFRIVKDVYRGKHKKFNRNWNLVAMLVNFSYDICYEENAA